MKAPLFELSLADCCRNAAVLVGAGTLRDALEQAAIELEANQAERRRWHESVEATSQHEGWDCAICNPNVPGRGHRINCPMVDFPVEATAPAEEGEPEMSFESRSIEVRRAANGGYGWVVWLVSRWGQYSSSRRLRWFADKEQARLYAIRQTSGLAAPLPAHKEEEE